MSESSKPQVITCKAAVCWGTEDPLKVEEIQVDPPKSSEVRVKMLCASLCHTDIVCARGWPFAAYPRVLGHEGVGIVESMGDKVKGLQEGDLVIPVFVGECQECENCKSGKTNLCLTHPVAMNFSGLMPDGTSRMSVGGQRLYHVLSCSTWTEYMVTDANYVVKVDPSMKPHHASFLSCGFASGLGSTWKQAKVKKGSSVAVFGLGAVGLGAIEGARIRGAARIIGVDKNERKKAVGEAFGMTDFINPDKFDKPISEIIRGLTGGMGVDCCFECAGVPSLVNQALHAVKWGTGKAILIGAGNDPSMQIDYRPLMCGVQLEGSNFGGIRVKSDLPVLLDKCKNEELHLDELLTHEIPFEDVTKAFELVREPDCVKVLIRF